MKIAGYETHPAADLFPMLDGDDLQRLSDDIRAHGLLDPIVLLAEGGRALVLDGRNRLRACEMAGVSPSFDYWMSEGSPTEWVVSRNLHRRHLTASQRAMVAAGLVPMFEAEARARKVANLKHGEAEPEGANLRSRDKGKSTEKAAAAVNVSARSVESALKVAREAPAEVVEAVKRGEVAVSAAAKAIEPRQHRESRSSKEEDWDCAVTLTVPHSAVPALERLLVEHGFTGSAVRTRKMKLRSADALTRFTRGS